MINQGNFTNCVDDNHASNPCGYASHSENNTGRNHTISVIMPVYNAEEHLSFALDDIFKQTMYNFELICVDDGSDDRSLEILKLYSEAHSNMIVMKQNNQSAGAARNRGMYEASGDYLLFLDSDDRFEPDLLELMISKALETNSDIVICKADEFHNQTGQRSAAPWTLRTNLINDDTFRPEDCSEFLFQLTIPNPWNKLFKKSFIKEYQIEFQHIPRTNDAFFVYSAMFQAETISIVPKVLIHYRTGNPKSLQRTNYKSIISFYDAYLGLKQALIENNEYELYRQSFADRALRACIYHVKGVHTPFSIILIITSLKQYIFEGLDIDFKDEKLYRDKNAFKHGKFIAENRTITYILRRSH